MRAQDTRWTIWGDRTVQGAAHDLCLSRPRHCCDQGRHTKNRRNGQRDGRPRDFVQRPEPALCHLLLSAEWVQCHNFHIHSVGKICFSGIVECQVAVLANTQQGQLWMSGSQRLSIFAAYLFEILSIPRNGAKRLHGDMPRQVIAEEMAEGGGMICVQADVFVQMESADMFPRQAGCGDQCTQGFQLGSCRGKDHSDAVLFAAETTKRACGSLSRCFSGGVPRGMNFDLQGSEPKVPDLLIAVICATVVHINSEVYREAAPTGLRMYTANSLCAASNP